jgi:predicted  nucleic acid-binding Zn-ribbon protein
MSVENAEQTIHELGEKRARALTLIREIAEERKFLVFAAHANGDAKARKRLEALNLESAAVALELEALDAALSEANSRLIAARRAAASEEDRENALALRGALAAFKDRGHKLSAALEVVVTETNGLCEALNHVHVCGSVFPTRLQTRCTCQIRSPNGAWPYAISSRFPAFAAKRAAHFFRAC